MVLSLIVSNRGKAFAVYCKSKMFVKYIPVWWRIVYASVVS